jgi:hypothetical protein
MLKTKSIIVVTWDGKSQPLSHILNDCSRAFDLLLYDYSGQANAGIVDSVKPSFLLSKKSECKGDVLLNVYSFLQTIETSTYEYIGLLDDDLYFSNSDLNKLLFIANLEKLDVFQASLTHDSYYHHRQFIHKPGYLVQDTWWVEIMAPFYRMEVFLQAGPLLNHSISGTGVDVYLIPTVQRLIGKNKTAIVHAIQMKHCRPIRTDNRIFSNGKNNLQEIAELQIVCKQLATSRPELFDEAFNKNILNRKYIYGIPLQYKIQRIGPMIKNLYKLLVDASYR